MKLFIDTSIFVDVLKKSVVASSKSLFDSLLRENEGFISSITVAELSVGAHLSPMSDAIEKTLDSISLVSVINLSTDIAFRGGEIYSKLVRKGLEIELNDCLIAATSVSMQISEIVTRNRDHFERMEDINPITPEDLGFR
jgi:tRNA(fMet)-specific endonuclease VapC